MHGSHFEQFVERESRRDCGAYERAVLFRWMQLLGQHHHIYNVNNAHHCFEHTTGTHRPPHIVRPFASVPQFYGCLQCGRSHHCWGERDSCELVYSNEHERIEVCRYSGRVVRNQDNLRATFEDTSRRRRSLAKHLAQSPCPRDRSAVKPPDRAARKRESRIRELKMKRKRQKKQRLPRAQLEDYALSLESISESESGDSSSSSSSEHSESSSVSLVSQDLSVSGEAGDDSGEEAVANDEGRKRARDEASEHTEEEASVSGEHEEEEPRGEPVGSDDWVDLEGEERERGFCKNYHNNLQYNNEQYAFMGAVIRKWRREQDVARLFTRDLSEGRAPPASEQCGEEAQADEPDRVFALQEPLRNKIYQECELLLHALLACRRAPQHLAALQAYYAPLLCNVAALVYASEKLSMLAKARAHKNQKQQRNTLQLLKLGLSTIDCARLDTLQEDEFREFTLEPRRLCRVLLHYLLVRPLSLCDALGNRVDVWYGDAWLAHTTPLLPEVEQQRRELTPLCELVRECLTSYARCPYWARAMIYWPEAA